jgi:hypothetical protein
MNLRTAILAATVTASPWSVAQKVVQEPQEDPVQAAIREFNSREPGTANEVTVVLPPSDEPLATPGKNPEPAAESPTKAPVLVTGTAPEGTELVGETAKPEAAADSGNPAAAADEPPPPPRQGLAVHVEKLQSGSGTIDPSKVKLLAPFPAKPLAQPPAGWRMETSENAPPVTREVELAPGKTITLSIRPHLLVPEANGSGIFTVSEPGFDPALGYRQSHTVGAVLSHSVRQLDEDAVKLGNALDNLQQLLVSLPKPEPAPTPAPQPEPAPTRKR